ncbi:MAG: hypothetical protein JJU11_10620 [Candidatus Sumerlaeia bacterium]|nr:hypothetical protein [Candidatus Sumerlaeia bacterium]
MTIVIHLIGLFIAMHTRVGSSLGGVALMDWGIPHATIGFHERLWSKVLLLLGISLLIRPFAIVAGLIGGAIMLEAWAAYSFGGNHFSEWSMWSSMLRYMAPLSLAVFLLPGKVWKYITALWMLRIAVAVVFAVHGFQALGRHPGFIDLLIGTSRNLIGYRLTESTAVVMLQVIGVVDVIVAIAVLIGKWRPLLAWLCFWSAITAASRVTALGIMSYPEILLRSSHILAPVAIYTLGRHVDEIAPGGLPAQIRRGFDYLSNRSARQGAASLAPQQTGTQTRS